MFKMNQKGVSLIEMIMAASVLGVVAIGMTRLMQSNQKQVKTVEMNSEITAYLNEVRLYLNNPSACFNSFNGINPRNGVVSDIKDKDNNIKLSAPAAYGSSGLKIKSFRLSDSDYDPTNVIEVITGGQGSSNFIIEFDRGDAERSSSSQIIEKHMKIFVETDVADNLIACRAMSAGTSDIWIRSSVDPNNIHYSDGNVGVGIEDAGVRLDVNGTTRTSLDFCVGSNCRTFDATACPAGMSATGIQANGVIVCNFKHDQSCAANQLARGFDNTGNIICGNYSDIHLARNCPGGEFVTSINADGSLNCSPPPPPPAPPASAGSFAHAATTCPPGEFINSIRSIDGLGTCGTPPAAGAGAKANQSCPAGQFVTGFNATGDIICAPPTGVVPASDIVVKSRTETGNVFAAGITLACDAGYTVISCSHFCTNGNDDTNSHVFLNGCRGLEPDDNSHSGNCTLQTICLRTN